MRVWHFNQWGCGLSQAWHPSQSMRVWLVSGMTTQSINEGVACLRHDTPVNQRGCGLSQAWHPSQSTRGWLVSGTMPQSINEGVTCLRCHTPVNQRGVTCLRCHAPVNQRGVTCLRCHVPVWLSFIWHTLVGTQVLYIPWEMMSKVLYR